MTPYVATLIPEIDIELFQKIKQAVNDLPNLDLGLDGVGKRVVLSCHILARAVAEVFHLKCIDGYFCHGYQHSWVLTPNQHIIDVYPVAILGGPILCEAVSCLSPARKMYAQRNSKEIVGGFLSQLWFENAIRVVATELRKAE